MIVNKMDKRYTTIDLFAGIGGMRKGFEDAGFSTVYANDFDNYCKITYDLNFDEPKLLVKDITKIKFSEIPDGFDVLLAGFPCQPFSIAGYQKGFEDKGRGNLFFNILKILKAKNPPALLLENVKNLKVHDNGNTFNAIGEALQSAGYKVRSAVLNSMEYGNVPQNRERIYIVGFKSLDSYNAFEFPNELKLTKSIADILERNVEDKYYYNNKPLFEKLKNKIVKYNTVYQWRRVYVRENKKGVSPTLTANMGMGGHNVPIIRDKKGIRKLTPLECARLQGFENIRISKELTDSALYKQFGNSVSVPVMRRIANKIKQALDIGYANRKFKKRAKRILFKNA
jgi:DNA (cytosine-5)-methyltransferase 1